MDKKLKSIGKEVKKVEKDVKNVEKMDKKRDTLVEMGRKCK